MSYPNNAVFRSSVVIQPRVERRLATVDAETGALLLDGGVVGNPLHMHERPPEELPAVAERPFIFPTNLAVMALVAYGAWKWL